MTLYAFRTISFILTLLYTLVVLGTCSYVPNNLPQNQDVDVVPATQGGELISINIFQSREDISLPLQQAADAFVAEHPGTQIRIHSVDGAAQYQPALHAKLLGGEHVDIFHLFGAQDLMYLEEYSLPLTDLPWITETYSILLQPVTIDDAVYGIPYSLEATGLIANRTIFAAAGITLGEIETAEDLSEAFAELRTQIDSGELAEDFPELRYVTEFAAMDKGVAGEQLVDILLTDSFPTPQQLSDSKLLHMPLGDSVGDYVKLMARYSSSRADWEGLTRVTQSQQLENGIVSGRVAVIQQSTAIWPKIFALDETLANNLVLLPVPLEADAPGNIYVGAPCYWAINAQSDPESIALAKEFLTYLYEWDDGAQIVTDSFGVFSPYRHETEQITSSLYRQLISYLDYGNVKPYLHAEAPETWSSEVFMAALHAFYASDDLNWYHVISSSQTGWAALR